MKLELRLSNSLDEVGRLHGAVAAFLKRHMINERVISQIDLSLEEVFSNIVRHGFSDRKEHEIAVRLTVRGGAVEVRIEDDGREFNPLRAPAPDLDAPLERRRVGGLGIHLVRTLMDRTKYRRIKGKNVLKFGKRSNQRQE